MGNLPPVPSLSPAEQEAVLGMDVSVRRLCAALRDGARRGPAAAFNVVVMAGAGISVSAGIPDFRTPGSGLYANLQQYNLPNPESMFDIDFFRSNPKPFYHLAKELFPDNFVPTPAHFFIRLLQDKGVLKRCFTQNIDTLERAAGVEGDKLVEAHGSFAKAHCIQCGQEHSQEWMKEKIFADEMCLCTSCSGYVKPDIVFFGEDLPRRYAECRSVDLPEADLLIVMGTSLKVSPFAETMHDCNGHAPRLLLNLERVGTVDASGHGFKFDRYDNYRDVELLTSCDDGVRLLCDLIGWRQELEDLIAGHGGTALPVDSHPIPTDDRRAEYNFRRRLVPLRPAFFVNDPDMTSTMTAAVDRAEANNQPYCRVTSPADAAAVRGGTDVVVTISAGSVAHEDVEDGAEPDYTRDFIALARADAPLEPENASVQARPGEDGVATDVKITLPVVDGEVTDYQIWYLREPEPEPSAEGEEDGGGGSGQKDDSKRTIIARFGPITVSEDDPEAAERAQKEAAEKSAERDDMLSAFREMMSRGALGNKEGGDEEGGGGGGGMPNSEQTRAEMDAQALQATGTQTAIPSAEAKDSLVGASDGSLSVFRDESKSGGECVALHRYVADEDSWERVGEVKPSTAKSGLDGKLFDHVYPVEIDSETRGFLTLRIAFNKGDDPRTVATAFVEQHELKREYIKGIVQFVSSILGVPAPEDEEETAAAEQQQAEQASGESKLETA